MFDKRCRAGVERSLRPVGSGLKKAGISADQLTVLGLLLSAACAVTVANGWLFVGWCLLAASAVPDVLDGAVAKASGTSSPRGAFFDSVVDRVSDSLVLGGLAWYLANTHSSHVALLPLAILGASNLVSYERARAESLGFTARGGLMERAERMIAIGLGLLFSVILVPLLWLMLGLTVLTAVQRFLMVWRQASATVPRRPAGERLTGRWSGLRPSVGFGPDGERSRMSAQRGDAGSWRARRATRPRPASWRRARTRP
ncbi:MAG TPA: CDP-alcohol phosphatidyltransferase family protein [Acidimicrobiales bacterium]|nr:CDP-alcohol phosphatidyltransferase family protein [Acidimicrobiales bacterium]